MNVSLVHVALNAALSQRSHRLVDAGYTHFRLQPKRLHGHVGLHRHVGCCTCLPWQRFCKLLIKCPTFNLQKLYQLQVYFQNLRSGDTSIYANPMEPVKCYSNSLTLCILILPLQATNTFQAALCNSDLGSFVIYNYQQISWTFGSASNGISAQVHAAVFVIQANLQFGS